MGAVRGLVYVLELCSLTSFDERRANCPVTTWT